MSEKCVFCSIIRRELPAYIITEDENVIAFLSLENHPLVVPKQHIPNIYTLDEATGAYLMRATIQVARAVKAGLQCEGVYVTQANEPAAGQDVFHLHIHVYLRWESVDFRTQQIDTRIPEAIKEETRQKIVAALMNVYYQDQLVMSF